MYNIDRAGNRYYERLSDAEDAAFGNKKKGFFEPYERCEYKYHKKYVMAMNSPCPGCGVTRILVEPEEEPWW
ncbi:hypothetical protein [Nesterenkonia alba]|uniref:hypothetical protein n=1 Tax=Nesterenkonia alba TaxID=515814 RepID=UPI0012EB4C33|nr:hypothetical protein [Nesterenkonia alba]